MKTEKAFVMLVVCAAAMLGCGGGGATGSSTPTPASKGITSVVPTNDPEIAYSVTLTMAPFTVGPGQEIYMCQDFANPFHGVQADIKSYELHMSNGSHHMFAFYKTNATDGAIASCSGLTFAPFTFTAGSPDAVQTYPEGIGAAIPATTGFTLNVHFINPTPAPIQARVALTMHIAKSGAVTEHAGPIFLNLAGLIVPPTNQPSTSSSSFTLPQDVHLMLATSHMHKRATHFISKTGDGQTLFETTQWADPKPAIFATPLSLAAGSTIDWNCTYVNDSGGYLTFGESAANNVMCISEFIYYPVKDVANPVIGTTLAL